MSFRHVVSRSIHRLHPSTSRFLCFLILAVATWAVGGCSLKQSYPDKLTYIVAAERNGDAVKSNGETVLQVHTMRADAAFEGKAFVYRFGELRYEPDFYHEFLVSPRLLITEQVRQWLSTSGLFQAVLDPSTKADATLGLDGNIRALYADFTDKANSKAVLEIEFIVLKQETASPVLHQSYREEVRLDAKGAEAIAKGWSQCLSKILTRLEKDLGKGR